METKELSTKLMQMGQRLDKLNREITYLENAIKTPHRFYIKEDGNSSAFIMFTEEDKKVFVFLAEMMIIHRQEEIEKIKLSINLGGKTE